MFGPNIFKFMCVFIHTCVLCLYNICLNAKLTKSSRRALGCNGLALFTFAGRCDDQQFLFSRILSHIVNTFVTYCVTYMSHIVITFVTQFSDICYQQIKAHNHIMDKIKTKFTNRCDDQLFLSSQCVAYCHHFRDTVIQLARMLSAN